MSMPTKHYLFIGNCIKLNEFNDLPSIDLIVTSPPYFNAPFDYKELFYNYETFLRMIADFGRFYFKKMVPGAVNAINIDDMLINGIKYPIISDTIKIFRNLGYELKGRIIWKKPEGYIRISRRSGVLLQHPYPMYFYPDNLLESILIFQKPTIDDIETNNEVLLRDIWEITNVLPLKGRLETDIAAFPAELPERLINVFTKKNGFVCDPFLGSGTTMKVARKLNRNSIGIEILPTLVPIIQQKTGFTSNNLGSFLDRDELCIKYLENSIPEPQTEKNRKKDNFSLLHQTLDLRKEKEANYKYHLIILDFRESSSNILDEKFSKILEQLHFGRILIIFFDSSQKISNDKLYLDQLTDFVMRKGIKLRDKITIQHKFEGAWKVHTIIPSTTIFNHCYYEVLIFQKGRYNYKIKSKKDKIDGLIDTKQFQKEKWYLSIWDFNSLSRKQCDPLIVTRLIELFLYNDELVYSNIPKLKCLKRHFDVESVTL